MHAAVAQQLVLQLDGQRRLAGGGQARQPDGQSALVAQSAALVAGQGGGVEGDVADNVLGTWPFELNGIGTDTYVAIMNVGGV
jgi:hypothetical protein